MANTDTDSNASVRFDSWTSFYAEKAAEKDGTLQVIRKGKLSILNPLPINYVNDSERFKSIVATYPDGNFLVLLAGGFNVRIIHHCFVKGDPGSPTVVVGISGMRRTSPVKTINSNHAVILSRNQEP
jgi:hypothetical protein